MNYSKHRRYRVIARVDRADRNIHGKHVAMMEAALTRDIDELLACHEAHIRNTARALEHLLHFQE